MWNISSPGRTNTLNGFAASPAFQSAYKKEANDYAVYNRNNKIGNANYRKATNQDPATLNLLLKLVRP